MSLRFQIVENWANLRLPLNVQKPKLLQFQWGGLCPLADQMFCPWTLLGALPQIFILGWRYRARHGFLPPDVAG